VWDLAGVISGNVRVYFNNKKVQIKGFSQYADMYLKTPNDNEPLKFSDKGGKNERWHLIISQSEGQF
jgi:DNA topoisomerase-2